MCWTHLRYSGVNHHLNRCIVLFEVIWKYLKGANCIYTRVELLNQRVSVISDLLDMLKEHLNSSHGEQLEWIVIILIAFEIIIGVITISIDLLSYFHKKPESFFR
jgi:uncharacterized Rmd1/YagE family protein